MGTKHWMRIALLLVALAAAAFFAGCGGDGDAEGGESDGDDAASQHVLIIMKDNIFEPTAFTVPVNKEITFELKNEGQANHNMLIQSSKAEGQDIMSEAIIEPAKSSTFTATFKKKGSIKFVCSLHQPDMVGTLTVK